MAIIEWSSGSLKGQSHDNGPRAFCQDSSSTLKCGNYSISIVSDGHGGQKYFRSQIGSKLATTVSERILIKWLNKPTFEEELRNDASTTLRSISSEIVENWISEINNYDSSHPLEDWEIKYIQETEIVEDNPQKRYGATLIISVLSDILFFGMQIGDGDLVAILSDGSILTPIPEDPRLIDNLTTSLCGKTPQKDFRYCSTFNNVPAAVMVSSDGIRTTFTTESGFSSYAESVCVYCASGMLEKLIADLKRRTTIANKDDISCNVQYSPSKFEGVIEQFNKKYQSFFDHEKKVEDAKVKLKSYQLQMPLPGYRPRKKHKSKKR